MCLTTAINTSLCRLIIRHSHQQNKNSGIDNKCLHHQPPAPQDNLCPWWEDTDVLKEEDEDGEEEEEEEEATQMINSR